MFFCSKRIPDFKSVKQLFKDKSGIEVGGPSPIFNKKGLVPIYKYIASLDGCNFSSTTIWEGNITDRGQYRFYKDKAGVQFVSDATDLSFADDAKYDFLLSSNCLEHIANPMKAFAEWVRVVRSGGLILLAIPNKIHNFDHNRPDTSFEHLVDDFKQGIKEDDMTHLEEILQLHDLDMDKPAGNIDQFRARSLKNFENRALHQHVFNLDTLRRIYEYFNVEVIYAKDAGDFIVIGRVK